MRIETKNLQDGPVELEVNCAPEALDLADEEFRFNKRVTGKVVFRMCGDTVQADGFLETETEAVCVRCLKPAALPVRAHVKVTYEHNEALRDVLVGSADTEDETLAYFDGELICPEAELREALMLELPALPVCAETCRGLCPSCGADLNVRECSCPRESEDISWKSAIRKLRIE